MSTPNPVLPYRSERPRSIFGPLFLVAVGVVLLLCTTGVLHWRSFGWWFARYWPAILILWGVAKLAEYFRARQHGYPPPRLGAGSIVFLIFFILIGLTASQVSGLNWQGLRTELGDDSDMDWGNWFGSTYDFTDSFSLPMSSAGEIKVAGRHGDIKVTASTDGQAHVSVSKSLHSDSEPDADRQNQSTHAKFEQQGKIWILDLTGDNFSRGSFNLDLELPPNADLSVSTRNGNIAVEKRPGNVNLSTDHGDISLEDVKGDAAVHLKHGSIRADNVSGNLTVDGTVNDTNVTGIGGALTLTGTYWGDMELAHIAKQVHFMSSRTDLEFTRLDGEFTMQLDELRLNGGTGPFKLDTRDKSVNLEDVSGDIHVHDQNAHVEIHSKAPPGNIDVTTTKGDIDLTLPAAAAFQLDAQSTNGEIESDFAVSVDNSGNNAAARGTVGKGGPQVRLKTDRAKISLSKEEAR